MPTYNRLTARIRKDPLGTATLSQLRDNLLEVTRLALSEHKDDGEHWALEVPRSIGRLNYTGGTSYSLDYGFNSLTELRVGYRAAAGIITVHTDGSAFSESDTASLITASASEQTLNKPYIVIPIHGANSVTFYHFGLSSALGAGNTWALADDDMFLSFWGPQYAYTPTGRTVPEKLTRSNGLHYDVWSDHVVAQGEQRARLLAEHNTSGDHTNYEVAKGVACIAWDGGTLSTSYSIRDGSSRTDGVQFDEVTRNSIGDISITLSAATTPVSVFLEADYEDVGEDDADVYLAVPGAYSGSSVRVYIYKYDVSANTWGRADCGFVIVFHAEIA